MTQLKRWHFEAITALICKQSGLMLTPDKEYLLEMRLAPLARRYGETDYMRFVAEFLANPDSKVLTEIVEALMTHETYFFRDKSSFFVLENEILPTLRQQKFTEKTLRIWCAGCSTGQEPYSLAMMFAERAGEWRNWTIEIIASDISETPLMQARSGTYSQFEVQRGLPIHLLIKYFTQVNHNWVISTELRSVVKFANINLLDSPQPLGCFDLILCRNVLMYFEPSARANRLEAMQEQLSTAGVLMLGASESMLEMQSSLKSYPKAPGFYIRKGSTPANILAA